MARRGIREEGEDFSELHVRKVIGDPSQVMEAGAPMPNEGGSLKTRGSGRLFQSSSNASTRTSEGRLGEASVSQPSRENSTMGSGSDSGQHVPWGSPPSRLPSNDFPGASGHRSRTPTNSAAGGQMARFDLPLHPHGLPRFGGLAEVAGGFHKPQGRNASPEMSGTPSPAPIAETTGAPSEPKTICQAATIEAPANSEHQGSTERPWQGSQGTRQHLPYPIPEAWTPTTTPSCGAAHHRPPISPCGAGYRDALQRPRGGTSSRDGGVAAPPPPPARRPPSSAALIARGVRAASGASVGSSGGAGSRNSSGPSGAAQRCGSPPRVSWLSDVPLPPSPTAAKGFEVFTDDHKFGAESAQGERVLPQQSTEITLVEDDESTAVLIQQKTTFCGMVSASQAKQGPLVNCRQEVRQCTPQCTDTADKRSTTGGLRFGEASAGVVPRCCRCRHESASYFDHHCPKCPAIMCVSCLEDFRLILKNYRCPACGDEKANQEALENEVRVLNAYRVTERTFGSIRQSIAGFFGLNVNGH